MDSLDFARTVAGSASAANLGTPGRLDGAFRVLAAPLSLRYIPCLRGIWLSVFGLRFI